MLFHLPKPDAMTPTSLTLCHKTLSFFPAADFSANHPLLLSFLEAGEAAEFAALLPVSINLLVLHEPDWEASFSPWPAPKAFKSAPDFSGGADAYLTLLDEHILPEAFDTLSLTPVWQGLAGYSLGGLFALYAACKSRRFSRTASVSGSLWFDGWLEWMQQNPPAALPQKAYFSVGDNEARSKNPRMAVVETNTRAAAECWQTLGIRTTFELNPGGHFEAVPQRMAKAAAWLLAD
ncbi:MAG: alpha/beta hydrolase-fold protein [Neisseria sp.]|nr:alpha/beta hydrolase-fold protein [Neisseria sp.]